MHLPGVLRKESFALAKTFAAMVCFFGWVGSVLGASNVASFEKRARREINDGLTYAGAWHGDSWCFEDPGFKEHDQEFEFIEIRGLTYEVKPMTMTKTDRRNGFSWGAQVKFDSKEYRVQKHSARAWQELSEWFSSHENQGSADRPELMRLFQGDSLVWIVVMGKKDGTLDWFQCNGTDSQRSEGYRSFYDAIRDRVWRQDTCEINGVLVGLLKKIFPDFHRSDLHDNSLTVRNDALPDDCLIIRDFSFVIDASASPPAHLPPRSAWPYFSKVSFASREIAYAEAGSTPRKLPSGSDEAKSLIPSQLSRPLYVGGNAGKLHWYDADGNLIAPDEYFSATKLSSTERP